MRWATTFQGDVQDKLTSYIFTNWAKADPDAAVREVLRQRNGAVRDRIATQVISGLLQTFNVAAAERLFQALDSVGARREAAGRLRFYFEHTDVDPEKANYYGAILRASRQRGP